MTRSSYKGPQIQKKLLKNVQKADLEGSTKQIKTWARSSTIVPEMVGKVIAVHNGKVHIPVFITAAHVGDKLGSFSPTRTFRSHSGDKKGKKK